MFSSKEELKKRTGECGIGRFNYLQSLVTEYQDTDNNESKQQVLANLANFAYDPINYGHFQVLNIVDLFLDALEESNEKLIEYAIGGVCNCCLDKRIKLQVIQHDGVKLVTACLSSPNEETVLSAITTLMYLTTPESKKDIMSLPVVECMLRFSEASNKRLGNLAKVFLQDYCLVSQVEAAKEIQHQLSTPKQWNQDI
ncbi:armadillo repeat-containing protein 7-like [Ylistrum balloti]|uniref:armadillo repeat-containing protein 7-like n=1 Tax=Ylistrum balloti TaxID=509963 RepID=UPI0029058D81|nr:armadillo repeat-containing protein 7-like [Ylistrum balloti]